jgi:hypothetical protein
VAPSMNIRFIGQKVVNAEQIIVINRYDCSTIKRIAAGVC